MGIVQRCETPPLVRIVPAGARRRCFDAPVAMVEEIPAIATVGFNAAAAFVHKSMMSTT